MGVLWAVNHGLGSLSKIMNATLGVTGPQRLVVRIVGHMPGVSAGRLAAILRVHPSTLTGVLRRLAARGLITREADALDGRRALFHLTALGSSIDRLRSGTVEAAISKALRGFTEGEARGAERILSAIAGCLEREARRAQASRRPKRRAR